MPELQCPQCQHDFVQRVPRRWMMERVISWVYIYPFRCQLCGYRFRVQQWGVRYTRHAIDRRHYTRMATTFPVTFASPAGLGDGIGHELSLGGCGLRTAVPAPVGALLQMQLHLPDGVAAIPVEAAVVRSVRAGFVGIEFLRLAPLAHERLGQVMYDLLAARHSTH